MIGTIHPSKTMFLRVAAGEAKDSKGHAFELTVNLGNSHPIVQSRQTGKWFTLSWQEIIELAIAAGIEKREPEAAKPDGLTRA